MAFSPDPARAKLLADARRQAHHAAQFAAAAGISFLPRQADDSHTNLEWLSELGALASHVVRSNNAFRVGIRLASLELSVLDSANAIVMSLPLHRCTIAEAE